MPTIRLDNGALVAAEPQTPPPPPPAAMAAVTPAAQAPGPPAPILVTLSSQPSIAQPITRRLGKRLRSLDAPAPTPTHSFLLTDGPPLAILAPLPSPPPTWPGTPPTTRRQEKRFSQDVSEPAVRGKLQF